MLHISGPSYCVCNINVPQGNVLVNNHYIPLLTDFGLSTFVDKAESNPTTETGIRLQHTIRFAAPELLLDQNMHSLHDPAKRRRSKTPQTDVYAFGMLMLQVGYPVLPCLLDLKRPLLQVFTGSAPWEGCNRLAVILHVCTGGAPQRPNRHTVLLGLTGSWWDVCLRCWQFDPASRLAIDEVWNELLVRSCDCLLV